PGRDPWHRRVHQPERRLGRPQHGRSGKGREGRDLLPHSTHRNQGHRPALDHVPGRRLLARGRPGSPERAAMRPRNMRRLKLDNGFTTVVVMGMMLVGMLLVAAAFAASDGDTKSARHDQYYKEAYNAADAGIN